MDDADYTDELARDEKLIAFAENIMGGVKISEALQEKTNQEIGILLIEHIQADLGIFSPAYELIEDVLRRLKFDFEKWYDEEDEKAEDNLSNPSSN